MQKSALIYIVIGQNDRLSISDGQTDLKTDTVNYRNSFAV